MPLHPQAKEFLAAVAASSAPPVYDVPVERARQLMEAGTPLTGPLEEVAKVLDVETSEATGNVPVRLYYPTENTQPAPVLIYFHGGGWVTGSINTHDRVCRSLANAAEAVVASVDYRLAPEHAFPAAADDCMAAIAYLASEAGTLGLDRRRFAVGGDSAGGNLAAAAAIACRDEGGPTLIHQTLIYPVISPDFETESYLAFAENHYLSRAEMQWFWKQYLPSGHGGERHHHVAPMTAMLNDLPPALVLTAEYDPLRDEGEAYAAQLEAAGVPVVLKRYEGQLHGFIRRPANFDAARTAVQQIGETLREAFAKV